MNRVAIILPYYGTFPNYFDIWLYSAGGNSSIDFIIITDSNMDGYKIPENIKVISMSLEEIRKRISKEVDFEVSLESAYKLCDYKPTYGAIFEDLMSEYTHWGYCDSDIVFGDLCKFLTQERLSNYDRIYDLGHLCVYKNNPENNRRWKTKDNLYTYTYIEVFRVRHCKMFDERGGMWDIWKQSGASEFIDRTEIADIFVNPFGFTTWYSRDNQWYEYNGGRLVGHFFDKNGNERVKEFAYIHLQKRKMQKKCDNLNHFFIIPNGFVNQLEKNIAIQGQKISDDTVVRQSKWKRILGGLQKDELQFHLKVAFRRVKYWVMGKNRGYRYEYF